MSLENIASGFTGVDRTNDPSYFLEFLAAADQLPDVQRSRRVMREASGLMPGESALDIGCGLGSEVIAMARTAGQNGRAVGIDPSATMVETARANAAKEGVAAEFQTGDVHALAFSSNSFDVCRAERVFMYLKDPVQALSEMIRVTKPGGRIVIYDFDWDCIFAPGTDKRVTRSIVRALADNLPQGKIGGELFPMFHRAGLANVKSQPMAMTFPLSFYKFAISGTIDAAVRQGSVTEKDARGWWTDLETANEQGRYLLGMLGFVVSGVKCN
jgi:ubiquinone/menaquinone biosynthesis C-methylase UbiE